MMKTHPAKLLSMSILPVLMQIIIFGIFLPSVVAQTNSGTKILGISQITNMDPDIKIMIDAWPKGPATNGLFCALHLIPESGPLAQPVCHVNIVNDTTNFHRTCLNLPREALYSFDLFAADGKRIEKTPEGKKFSPWTTKKVDDWFQEQLRTRARNRYFSIWPFGYEELGGFKVTQLFVVPQAGEYTLHLSVLLIQATRDSNKDFHLKTTPLPEVVTKVQVLPGDIQRNYLDASTNQSAPLSK